MACLEVLMPFGAFEELNFSDFSVSIMHIITPVVFLIKYEIRVCKKKHNRFGVFDVFSCFIVSVIVSSIILNYIGRVTF